MINIAFALIRVPGKPVRRAVVRMASAGLVLLVGFCAGHPHCVFSPEDAGDITCRNFLEDLGWEVANSPAAAEPCDLSSGVEESYLALQWEAGLDLSPYLGRTVSRYTYRITIHPSGDTNITAVVLMWQGRIIGGDVHSPALDGFMQSLLYPGTSSG